jgi:hypothetical protein
MVQANNTIPCPHCGEPIKHDAKSCWSCGSDEKTGWSNGAYMDGIDTGEDFNYDEMLAKEFPHLAKKKKPKISWMTIVGAVVLFFFIAAFVKILL